MNAQTHSLSIFVILVVLSISLACGGAGKLVASPTGENFPPSSLPVAEQTVTGPSSPVPSALSNPPPTLPPSPTSPPPTIAPSQTEIPPTPASTDTAAPPLANIFDVESLLGLHTTQAVGSKKYNVIRADFPDVQRQFTEGLSSWTKLRLGWIDPSKIVMLYPGNTATIRLDPLASADSATMVIKIPISETTYYLIENRQPVESDVNLPSSGIMILFADDAVQECRHGQSPVKIVDANPSVPYFNDAAFDIGNNSAFTDIQNNLAVVLLRKQGLSYDVKITTPDQVK